MGFWRMLLWPHCWPGPHEWKQWRSASTIGWLPGRRKVHRERQCRACGAIQIET